MLIVYICGNTQFMHREQDDADEELDIKALENGFVSFPIVLPFFEIFKTCK